MKLSEIKLGNLNVLDIAIVFVVIVFAILFVGHQNTDSENSITAGSSNVSSKFVYEISIESLSNTSTEMLRVGDEVYDKISNTYIGKISELEIVEAQGLLETASGEVIRATVPGKIDVKMKVETEGTMKNGEYLANGLIRIMVGNQKQIKTKYLMCMGTISAIEK